MRPCHLLAHLSIYIAISTTVTVSLFTLHCTQIMCINFFYMLGMSTTLFILALLLVGGLGDYLKNIFMLTQNNILVMVIGCLLSSLSYVSHNTAATYSPSSQLIVKSVL